MQHVFVYGTLLPGEVRWHHLERYVVGGGDEHVVRGELFDTGLGYPAARFDGTGPVRGRCFTLDPDRLEEALALLDEIEDAVEGLYRRTVVTTDAGLEAWAYECGTLGDLRPIASGCWLTHTGVR